MRGGEKGGKPINISYFCIAAPLFNMGCSNSCELVRGWRLVPGMTRRVSIGQHEGKNKIPVFVVPKILCYPENTKYSQPL